MSTSSLTIDTAPRDPKQLALVGRFNLRRLAGELGMFTDEASKSRFMSGSNDDMAQAICVHLVARDGNGATAVQTPVAAAPQPAPSAVQRTPSNDAAKQTAAAAAPAPAPSGDLAGGILKNLQIMIKDLGETDDKVDAICQGLEAVGEVIEELRAEVRGNTRMAAINTALSLFLAEEVLKSSRKDILETAINDQESVGILVQELNKEAGKGQ